MSGNRVRHPRSHEKPGWTSFLAAATFLGDRFLALHTVSASPSRNEVNGIGLLGVGVFAKHFIESIASRRWNGAEPTLQQVEWLNSLSDELHQRIVKAGIADEREDQKNQDGPGTPPMGDFVQGYIDARTELKQSTTEQYGYTRRLLVAFFGADRELGSITRADAKAWQRWMKRYVWKPAAETTEAITLADATISKHSKRARTIFTEAVDARLIVENPMEAIKGGGEINRDRDYFVDRRTAAKVLDKCPDHLYRLAFALARYGGFRQCEILNVEWSDMLWDESKIRNRSPKTGLRFVPMFAEIRPYLDEADALAPDGQLRCMGRFAESTNLGVQMTRWITQAGVKPWKKPFQNLRPSRRTELEEQFPSHVCDAWLGHSTRVARQSYLQVTPDHWQAAIASPPKSDAVAPGMGSQALANCIA